MGLHRPRAHEGVPGPGAAPGRGRAHHAQVRALHLSRLRPRLRRPPRAHAARSGGSRAGDAVIVEEAMQEAIALARRAGEAGEVPVGAVALLDGRGGGARVEPPRGRPRPDCPRGAARAAGGGAHARPLAALRSGDGLDARAVRHVRRRHGARPHRPARLRGERPQGRGSGLAPRPFGRSPARTTASRSSGECARRSAPPCSGTSSGRGARRPRSMRLAPSGKSGKSARGELAELVEGA